MPRVLQYILCIPLLVHIVSTKRFHLQIGRAPFLVGLETLLAWQWGGRYLSKCRNLALFLSCVCAWCHRHDVDIRMGVGGRPLPPVSRSEFAANHSDQARPNDAGDARSRGRSGLCGERAVKHFRLLDWAREGLLSFSGIEPSGNHGI